MKHAGHARTKTNPRCEAFARRCRNGGPPIHGPEAVQKDRAVEAPPIPGAAPLRGCSTAPSPPLPPGVQRRAPDPNSTAHTALGENLERRRADHAFVPKPELRAASRKRRDPTGTCTPPRGGSQGARRSPVRYRSVRGTSRSAATGGYRVVAIGTTPLVRLAPNVGAVRRIVSATKDCARWP
jgi:hypothetical protein